MTLPMSVMAALIIYIGVQPSLILEKLVYPVLSAYTFDPQAAHHLLSVKFFTMAGLQEVILVTIIGVAIFTVGWTQNLLDTKIPRKLGPDYWYEKLATSLIWLAKGPFTTLDSAIDDSYKKTGHAALKVTKTMETFDAKMDHKYVQTGEDFSHATPAKSAEEYKSWVGHHPEKSDMIAENFMIYGDYVSNFDRRVVDGTVNQIGRSAWVVSAHTDSFDKNMVDGVVNWIADVLHRYGDIFRRSVTGVVNDYTSGIVIGAIMLWIFMVIGAR
ncbi:MAG TPA: hypothetical protein ENH13_00420 [Euryarchaeota archaeon]|nr:hypothetical protein [Euryarchaeota archaeon]